MDRLKMRSYNYVGDCAAALLSVLVQGNNGETYNLADPESVLTIANWQSWSLKLPAAGWCMAFRRLGILCRDPPF